MMVKRKLGGTVNKSSADQEIYKSEAEEHILCEISGGLHLVESGLMAGRQAG